jgi:hypothetical protein
MRIDEITLNDKDLVFEALKSDVAILVARLFLEYRHLTNNFSVTPQDVYSIEEISDILYELKLLRDQSTDEFDSTSQTVVILTALLNYFNTGF